jgi:hypothetical protein
MEIDYFLFQMFHKPWIDLFQFIKEDLPFLKGRYFPKEQILGEFLKAFQAS